MASYRVLVSMLVVLVASACCLASQCNFKLARNKNGTITRLELGNKIAVIKLANSWQGFVKDGSNLITTTATGNATIEPFDKMSDDERAKYDIVFNASLGGYVLNGENVYPDFEGKFRDLPDKYLKTYTKPDGHYLHFDGRGYSASIFPDLPKKEQQSIERFTKAPVDIEVANRTRFFNADLYAIFNANETASGFNHVLFMLPANSNSSTIIVDRNCTRMTIQPLKVLGF